MNEDMKFHQRPAAMKHVVFYALLAVIASVLTTIVMEKVFFRYEALYSD